MKKTKFTESQIIGILKEQEQGKKVADICRDHASASQHFINGKANSPDWMFSTLRK